MSHRIIRINKLIGQQLAILIQEEFAQDIGIISIVGVDSSRDLKNARVYIRVLDLNQSTKIINYLQKRAFFLQNKLIKILSIKSIPKIEFVLDNSQENINKVEQLLNDI